MIKCDRHRKDGRQRGSTHCPFHRPNYRNNVLDHVTSFPYSGFFLPTLLKSADDIPEAVRFPSQEKKIDLGFSLI